MNRILCAVLLCLAAQTVLADGPGEFDATAADIAAAEALIGPGWPAGPDRLATTDGEIFMRNLDGQIDALGQHRQALKLPMIQARLGALFYQKYQVEGRLEQALSARRWLAGAVEGPAHRPVDRVTYASVLAGFHEFDAAGQQLDLALAEGVAEPVVAAARAAIRRAVELPDTSAAAPTVTDYRTAVEAAAFHLERGQLERASLALRRGQDLYRDSSPVPLAWLYTQQGIAFLRHGRYAAAQTFFAAAHQRLPAYYLATEHLAEMEGLLGNHAESARLYRLVTRQNDQPAFWHALAGAELSLGNTEAAEEAAERARSGYQALLDRHELMFADHAVDYLLEVGETDWALRLARSNFAARRDTGAYLVLAEALLAAGSPEAACDRVAELRAARLAPPEITLPGEALAACWVSTPLAFYR